MAKEKQLHSSILRGMWQCGQYEFGLFAAGGNNHVSRELGPYTPAMTGTRANALMDHVGKLENLAQYEYIAGWDVALAAMPEQPV